MARFGESMLCYGVAVLGVLLDVAIRFDRDLCAAIAGIPNHITNRRPEASHLERDWISSADVHRGPARGMDRGRELVGMRLVDHEHHYEVVVHCAARVGDFENLAVLARLGI